MYSVTIISVTHRSDIETTKDTSYFWMSYVGILWKMTVFWRVLTKYNWQSRQACKLAILFKHPLAIEWVWYCVCISLKEWMPQRQSIKTIRLISLWCYLPIYCAMTNRTLWSIIKAYGMIFSCLINAVAGVWSVIIRCRASYKKIIKW